MSLISGPKSNASIKNDSLGSSKKKKSSRSSKVQPSEETKAEDQDSEGDFKKKSTPKELKANTKAAIDSDDTDDNEDKDQGLDRSLKERIA